VRTVITWSAALIHGRDLAASCLSSSLARTVLVLLRCFYAVAMSASRCSDSMPG
jgi:hypothetical protein